MSAAAGKVWLPPDPVCHGKIRHDRSDSGLRCRLRGDRFTRIESCRNCSL